jgi:enamine deaminase RidA (YjgF/YER057c/UK114 family)
MSDRSDATSARRLISSGSSFEALAGYSRAVVDGRDVHVSGTTGFDYATMAIADDVVVQTRQCLANIAAVLAQAGCTLDDVVRVRYLLTDAAFFERVAPLFGETFARARPAATAMVVGLVDARMKIEIEVDARIPAPPAPPPHDWGPVTGA